MKQQTRPKTLKLVDNENIHKLITYLRIQASKKKKEKKKKVKESKYSAEKFYGQYRIAPFLLNRKYVCSEYPYCYCCKIKRIEN